MGDLFMVRTIKSGSVFEKTKFRVHPNVRPRRGRKKGGTSTRKQDINDRDATKRLARSINCNFGRGDYFIGLTYSPKGLDRLFDKTDNPEDPEQVRAAAEHELALFIRRLSRRFEKAGGVLKYIAVTSDIDGETGEVARIHHHIVVTGCCCTAGGGELYICGEPFDNVWGLGDVDWKPLKKQPDYTPLAEYLMRQVRRRPDGKKYSPSRNLEKPVVVSEKLVRGERELKAPGGAVVLHRGEFSPGSPQYVRYVYDDGKTEAVKVTAAIRRKKYRGGMLNGMGDQGNKAARQI